MISGAAGSRRRNAWPSVRRASASTWASRRSSLAPAGEKRSRKRSNCLGLREWTGKSRSIMVSTTGPCGSSIAIPIPCGTESALARIQSAISARPAPLCGKARSPRILPERSTTQTWWLSEPQSMPAKLRRVSMSFLSIGLTERVATMPSGPCTGAPGANSPLGVHHGKEPGHRSPPGARSTGGAWLLPVPWPAPSATDEIRRMAGSADPFHALSGFPSALPAPGKPESAKRHSNKASQSRC